MEMKRVGKIFFIFFCSVLLFVGFIFADVSASDCEHVWGAWTSRDGSHRRVCSLCGTVSTGTCSYHSIILPPTCTTGGYTESTCTICGDKVIADKTDAVGHTWDAGTQASAATCVDSGELVYTCLSCGEKKSESIPATGKHTEVEDPGTIATCTAAGLSAGAHCSVCGKVLIAQKEIPKSEHTWDMENIYTYTAPTCQPGEERVKCKVCGIEGKREVKPIAEHRQKVVSEAVNATCTEAGRTQHVICSVCNEVLEQSEVIPATGHDWDVVLYTEQTCTQDGLCDRKCKTCKTEEKNVKLPATGHNPVVVVTALAPTCTSAGYTAAISCEYCGEVFARSEPVAALGHQYVQTANREPTCSADGKITYTCIRCPASYAETVKKLGHDMYIASTTEPTCTTLGLAMQRCRRCTHTISQSIKALGHDEKYETIAPTCTENGYTRVFCTRCDYEGQLNIVPPTGHSPQLLRTVAPTCTDDGYDVLHCTVCSMDYNDNITPMLGHSWAPGIIISPTCTEGGYTEFSCLRCTEKKTDLPVPAAGHSLTDLTVNGDGSHTGRCAVCGKSITERCSGGTLSCLAYAVCAICGGNYGSPTGQHSFTKYTVVDNSYHRLDCANCEIPGAAEERHSFVQGAFDVNASGYLYTCRVCNHQVWGRPIGDADGNGSVADAADARAALRYSVGLETPNDAALAAADVDGDDAVTASDARLLLRASVGLEAKSWSVLFVTENGNLP